MILVYNVKLGGGIQVKFRVNFREYEILQNEKGDIISRSFVHSWSETIEASTLEEVFEIAEEKAKKIMKEDSMAEITYEVEAPINLHFS